MCSRVFFYDSQSIISIILWGNYERLHTHYEASPFLSILTGFRGQPLPPSAHEGYIIQRHVLSIRLL